MSSWKQDGARIVFFLFSWAASEKGKAYLKFSTILNPSKKNISGIKSLGSLVPHPCSIPLVIWICWIHSYPFCLLLPTFMVAATRRQISRRNLCIPTISVSNWEEEGNRQTKFEWNFVHFAGFPAVDKVYNRWPFSSITMNFWSCRCDESWISYLHYTLTALNLLMIFHGCLLGLGFNG